MQILPGLEDRFYFWLEKHGGLASKSYFAYAVEWANELEKMIKDPALAKETIWENADAVARFVAIKYGIQPAGGYAVNILSQYWEYGDVLREWYNKKGNQL